jgi:8-oxo-dGTP diphosphatase
MSAGRRPTSRLLVSPETATAVDTALIDAMSAVRRKVSKTDLADALIRVGLNHTSEVQAALQEILSGVNPVQAPVSLTTESRHPEPPPVVAGIVTSALGVLVGQRRDGKPPWTFIAGKIEPGESPADAAVREVKEETGLRVVAAEREIGRRVHPQTGRTMIYLACSPTGKTDVIVGDQDELSAVEWINLEKADERMPGMFEPVRQYLAEHLDPDAPGQNDTP